MVPKTLLRILYGLLNHEKTPGTMPGSGLKAAHSRDRDKNLRDSPEIVVQRDEQDRDKESQDRLVPSFAHPCGKLLSGDCSF